MDLMTSRLHPREKCFQEKHGGSHEAIEKGVGNSFAEERVSREWS